MASGHAICLAEEHACLAMKPMLAPDGCQQHCCRPLTWNKHMRRLLEVGCISTFALATFVGISGRAEGQVVTPRQVDVSVDIRCLPGNGVSFSLVPWAAQLAPGDSIAWLLSPDAGVPEITITSKQTAWPFVSGPPYKGNAARPPKARGMKAGVKAGDKYSYAVTAVCTRADGTVSNVIIDPDMIIIPGKT